MKYKSPPGKCHGYKKRKRKNKRIKQKTTNKQIKQKKSVKFIE